MQALPLPPPPLSLQQCGRNRFKALTPSYLARLHAYCSVYAKCFRWKFAAFNCKKRSFKRLSHQLGKNPQSEVNNYDALAREYLSYANWVAFPLSRAYYPVQLRFSSWNVCFFYAKCKGLTNCSYQSFQKFERRNPKNLITQY